MRKILLKEAFKPTVDLSSDMEYKAAKRLGLEHILSPFQHTFKKEAINNAFNDVAKRVRDPKALSDLKTYAEALEIFHKFLDNQLSSSEVASFKRAANTITEKYKKLASIFGRERTAASKEGHEKIIAKHLEKAAATEAQPLSLRKLRKESYNWKNRVKFYLGEY